MYYTATVKVLTEDENGKTKGKNENYLVESLLETPTDVEKIINDYFEKSSSDFKVVKIAKSNIIDVLPH